MIHKLTNAYCLIVFAFVIIKTRSIRMCLYFVFLIYNFVAFFYTIKAINIFSLSFHLSFFPLCVSFLHILRMRSVSATIHWLLEMRTMHIPIFSSSSSYRLFYSLTLSVSFAVISSRTLLQYNK